jgi:hypothetical protein
VRAPEERSARALQAALAPEPHAPQHSTSGMPVRCYGPSNYFSHHGSTQFM